MKNYRRDTRTTTKPKALFNEGESVEYKVKDKWLENKILKVYVELIKDSYETTYFIENSGFVNEKDIFYNPF